MNFFQRILCFLTGLFFFFSGLYLVHLNISSELSYQLISYGFIVTGLVLTLLVPIEYYHTEFPV